jgi:phospholipase/carboxylesterase
LAEKQKAEAQQLEERLGDEMRGFKGREASKLREGGERRRKRIADYARSVRNGEPLHANKFRRTGATSMKSTAAEPNLSGRISTLRPHGPHEYTLIYLHQFCLNGTNYMDWKPHYFFSATKLPYLNLKVTLPTAKAIPITVHEGCKQYAWYDYKTDYDGKQEDKLDRRSLQETRDRIFTILDREIAMLGGDASKVFLGGASQGCCTALHCALQYPRKLGGFVGVVGHLLSITPLPSSKSSMPIYLYNGLADRTMRWSWVSKTYSRFREAEYTNVHIHKEEGITHEKLAGNERKWILKFLSQTIPKDTKG